MEAADKKEIASILQQGVWEKVRRTGYQSGVMDAIWVRKWKRMPNGTLEIKSRLCLRGYLDPQKDALSSRATTATRLSQRLLISMSVLLGFEVESLDVSTAFLKGFSWKKLEEALRKRGLEAVSRVVLFEPPANVWRIMNEIGPAELHIPLSDWKSWLLKLLKAMYGLNDAPLSWQLCLIEFYTETLHGQQSVHDDCFFMWFDDKLQCRQLATAHVDDNGVGARSKDLDIFHTSFTTRFGKVTRQRLPFTHCGATYMRNERGGISILQTEFCKKLTVVYICPRRDDHEVLQGREHSLFRSQVGAVLWLCLTRIDLIADTVLLQQELAGPKVIHLRATNLIIKRAKRNSECFGLHFNPLIPPLKLMEINDASHANSRTSYAIDGILTLLMEDHAVDYQRSGQELTDQQVKNISGFGHALLFNGQKARRISYSTSHAETLAACKGRTGNTMVNLRLTEILGRPNKKIADAIHCYENSGFIIPSDHMTDCHDMYDLISGNKPLPQDRTQRMYVMSLREERVSGRLRYLYKTPTESMLADAITKSGFKPQMMDFLSTGLLVLRNEPKQKMSVRYIKNYKQDATEEELATLDDERYNVDKYGIQHSYNMLGYFSRLEGFDVEPNIDFPSGFDAFQELD